MVSFIVPSATAPSGGHAYNRAVIADWPGPRPRVVTVPGPWPHGDRNSLTRLREALRAPGVALVDGLVGAAHPDLLAESAARGCRIVLLVHLPLADEGGLTQPERSDLDQRELRSARGAWRVVATSRTAARELARRTGRSDVAAVPPGVHRAPLADPHRPAGILQVGAIGPRKNQLVSLAALAACSDLGWHATFVGPVADPDYAERCRSSSDPSRITWAGPLEGAALDIAYASSDLLLHPALAETWGMVVTEALARGIPAVVGAGTGAVEALGSATEGVLPGASVPPTAPDALAGVLRRWLTEPDLRLQWRDLAIRAREGLRDWPRAAAELADLVEDR